MYTRRQKRELFETKFSQKIQLKEENHFMQHISIHILLMGDPPFFLAANSKPLGPEGSTSFYTTVPGLEIDRWKYYNCIIPESCSALRFFLFIFMCLVLVLTKFQRPRTWTFCLRGFVRYRTKVLISLFEKQKITSLNIRIASFLRVAAPWDFFYLSVCVSC